MSRTLCNNSMFSTEIEKVQPLFRIFGRFTSWNSWKNSWNEIQENQQEFERKCGPVQAIKSFLRLSLKATKLFESNRSQVTWYFEGSELASDLQTFIDDENLNQKDPQGSSKQSIYISTTEVICAIFDTFYQKFVKYHQPSRNNPPPGSDQPLF